MVRSPGLAPRVGHSDLPGYTGSDWRLIEALLAKKHERWSTSLRCLKTDAFYEWLDRQSDTETTEIESERVPQHHDRTGARILKPLGVRFRLEVDEPVSRTEDRPDGGSA
jgi:hypothetical protein